MPIADDVKSSLLKYCHVALGYDKVNADEHGHLLRCLERNAQHILNPQPQQAQRIVLILLPRNTYKTTITSISFPMWLLEQDPNLSILVDSETYNLSKSILSEIKQQYESGPRSLLFSPIERKKATRWAEDSIIIPNRTNPKKEGSLNAAGIDGVKAGMHYPLLILDDLHSQHNTRSPQQIQEVIDHYKLMLPILSPGGLMIVIGTRWVAEDAYDTIAKDADETLIIPAVSDISMNLASVPVTSEIQQFTYMSETRDVEQKMNFWLNFPHTLPLSHLSRIQDRQDIYIYSAQYLLHPVASKEKRFRDEWLKFYKVNSAHPDNKPPKSEMVPSGYEPHDPPDLKSSQFRRIIIVDPAFTTSAYSDFSGIIVTATNALRHVYIAHTESVKLEPFSLLEKIFEMCDMWDTVDVYVEEVAAQKVLSHFMQYAAKHQERKISITPVKSLGRKKEIRIMALQPYFRSGLIWLNEEHKDLINQIKKYPILKHDDLIDALAYVPQVIYDGSPPAQREESRNYVTMDDLLNSVKKKQYTGIRPLDFDEKGQRGWLNEIIRP